MLDTGAETRPQVNASPGLVGYALAVAIAHVVLALGLGLRSASDPYWGFAETALLMFFGGLLPAAVLGSAGAAIVHFATRRASSHWPAVSLAGLLGLLAGLLV